MVRGREGESWLLTLKRVSGFGGQVSVTVSLGEVSPSARSYPLASAADVLLASQVITFLDGEHQATVSIEPLLDDVLDEGCEELVLVRLRNLGLWPRCSTHGKTGYR